MAQGVSRLAGFGVADRQLTEGERWMSFCCLFFFGFTAVYSMFKVGPVITDIGASFGMGIDTAGYINSVFAIAAAVFAFPGTWIMRNVGIKISLLVTAVITLIGTVIGYFTDSAAVFLLSRFLEGMGFGLIAVIGPNVMLRLVPPRRQGLVMGIWSNWLPVGTIIAFFSTPVLFEGFGWHSMWVLSMVLEAIMTIWLVVSFKLPKVAENTIVDGDVTKQRTAKKTFMASAILLGLTFFCWNLVYPSAVNGFYPTFLQDVKGMSVWTSSFVTVLAAIITVPVAVISGIICDRTNSRKWHLIIAYALFAVMAATFAFTESPETATPWIFTIILGVIAGVVPQGTRSYVPVLARDPQKADYALAVMAFTTGLGMLMSGFVGSIIAEYGYHMMGVIVIAPACIAAVVMILLCKSDKAAIRENEGEA